MLLHYFKQLFTLNLIYNTYSIKKLFLKNLEEVKKLIKIFKTLGNLDLCVKVFI